MEAVQEKDFRKLTKLGAAVRGRIARADHVVLTEMENYESGPYIETVTRAVLVMRNNSEFELCNYSFWTQLSFLERLGFYVAWYITSEQQLLFYSCRFLHGCKHIMLSLFRLSAWLEWYFIYRNLRWLNEFLPWIFAWGAYYVSCQKKNFKKKILLWASISNVGLGLF